jgi:hypothetical protein
MCQDITGKPFFFPSSAKRKKYENYPVSWAPRQSRVFVDRATGEGMTGMELSKNIVWMRIQSRRLFSSPAVQMIS